MGKIKTKGFTNPIELFIRRLEELLERNIFKRKINDQLDLLIDDVIELLKELRSSKKPLSHERRKDLLNKIRERYEKINDMSKCNQKKCRRKERWEIGFSAILQNDSGGFLAGDELDFTAFFCDKHFVGLSGCGNVINFRQLGKEEWMDFDDHDNPFILRDLVKNSYKLYLSENLRFKNITNFNEKK